MENNYPKNYYSKKSTWKWILLYVVIGVVAYGLIYYFFYKTSSKSQNENSNVQTDDCSRTVTTVDINNCIDAEIVKNNEKMSEIYSQLLLSEYRDSFIKSQDAWLKYRDAECDAEAGIYGGGSIVSTTHLSCFNELTKKRIEELRENLYSINNH